MHSTRTGGAGVRTPVRLKQDYRHHARNERIAFIKGRQLGKATVVNVGFMPELVVFRAREPRHTHRGLGGRFAKAPVLDPKWLGWVRDQMLHSMGVPETFYQNRLLGIPHAVVNHLNEEREQWRVSHVSQLRAQAERVSLPTAEGTWTVSH